MIVGHGDENGLVVPPKLAPTQVIIVPVDNSEELLEYCRELQTKLKEFDIRTKLDDRDDERFGFKLNKWEVKGVPIALKIGKKELEEQTVTAKRRDNGEEVQFSFDEVQEQIPKLLVRIQAYLLEKSRKIKEESTREVSNYEDFKVVLKEHKGFVKVYWNDNPEIEKKIKEDTMAVSRCLIEETSNDGVDFYTGEPSKTVWLFAQAY